MDFSLADTPNDESMLEFPLKDFLIQYDLSDLTKSVKKSSNENICIFIKCNYPDPLHPGKTNQIIASQSCKSSQKVSAVVKDFLETHPEIPKNREYYLGYEQLLFREGTLRECGITHNKSVELYSPGKNASSYHNEGLRLIVWAIIPFVIGLAAILFSITSDVKNESQALFLFLGLLLLIPSSLLITIGLILIPAVPMPCYFVGTKWW